jgi:ribosomal protein S27E
MRGLDAWITGGRYSRELLDVTCPGCKTTTVVVSETDYGATDWSPEKCQSCGEELPADAASSPAQPPERDGDEEEDAWERRTGSSNR